MRIDRRTSLTAFMVAGLFLPAAAQAASFDCAHAASAIEKRICANPVLCCPTGGSVRGALKRVGLRIVVDRAVFDAKPLAD